MTIPNPATTARKLGFTSLLAGDGKGFMLTVIIALALSSCCALLVHATFKSDEWAFQFFFHRSFVQWVLLTSFFAGMVHLARRIPGWRKELVALNKLRDQGIVTGNSTLVERRWIRLQHASAEASQPSLVTLAASLAEHDDAEIDTAYRLSSDIVQMLPLVGFFGTVFGLSQGLYKSFLATGEPTTKEFAKAIAIAFDNTLLGLALTILLFTAQSLLRKRDDTLLLELNLLTSFTPDK